MGYVQATISLLVGLAVFDPSIRGSLPLLYGLTSFFIIVSTIAGRFNIKCFANADAGHADVVFCFHAECTAVRVYVSARCDAEDILYPQSAAADDLLY